MPRHFEHRLPARGRAPRSRGWRRNDVVEHAPEGRLPRAERLVGQKVGVGIQEADQAVYFVEPSANAQQTPQRVSIHRRNVDAEAVERARHVLRDIRQH